MHKIHKCVCADGVAFLIHLREENREPPPFLLIRFGGISL